MKAARSSINACTAYPLFLRSKPAVPMRLKRGRDNPGASMRYRTHDILWPVWNARHGKALVEFVRACHGIRANWTHAHDRSSNAGH